MFLYFYINDEKALKDRMNNTTLPQIEEIIIPKDAALIASVFSVIIIIVGIIGNSLTIVALIKGSPKLQSHATTKFVINLAVTDLLFCSLNLPLTTVRYLTRSWPFGTFLCQLYPYFFYGNVATSLMSITFITFNRLVLIAFNDRYNRIYRKINVWLMISFCWVFSFGLMLMPLLGLWGRFGYRPTTFSCTILRDSSGHSPRKFLFIFGFALPTTIIIISYTIIWNHVRQQTSQTVKTSKRDLRLTKLIFVIFGTFLLCFAPLLIANVVISESKYPYLHVLAAILAWLNSCINPFIYFAMNRKYRTAFKRVLRGSYSTASAHGCESITSDQPKSPVNKTMSYIVRDILN